MGLKQISVENIHTPSEKLEVFLFNVGQGDHLLLKFPTLEYGIIDLHYAGDSDLKEPPSLTYFKALKAHLKKEFEKVTISFFCISHTDKDHIKGITETLNWFDKEGVFIRDIWLGAAREQQFEYFYKNKLIDFIKENLNLNKQLALNEIIELFKKNFNSYLTYFKKWKQKNFNSKRYKIEEMGDGEYLCDIRLLPNPSESPKTEALNIGPLSSQLDDYFDKIDEALVNKIFKIEDDTSKIDRNLLSHILRIKYGEINLLFGGDTHKDIWDKCLQKYDDPKQKYRKTHGNYDAHFVKVSHHGSKNSSNPNIWKKIIPSKGKVFLGISAGRNKKYKHPHSETLNDIKNVRNDSNILSTNICELCLTNSEFEVEEHTWYDEYNKKSLKYFEDFPSAETDKIIDNFEENSITDNSTVSENSNKGLFAYIFEIPEHSSDEIKVRVALTNTNKQHDCFFKKHQEKLQDNCNENVKTC